MKLLCVAAAAVLLASPLSAQSDMHTGHSDTAAPKTPMILDGYGAGGFPVTTSNPRAQAYFDNGMQLAHAFAHKASIEAMEEAVRLDPTCAMCYWGEAFVLGPNINYPMVPDAVEPAFAARKARRASAWLKP